MPLWSNTAGTYTYQMVGTSPLTTNVTTTIAAPLIPLILTFSDGTVLDPTVAKLFFHRTHRFNAGVADLQ